MLGADEKGVVDHIRERPQGVAQFLPEFDNLENLQFLCYTCHNRKTFTKKPSIGPDGFPVDSEWS